MEILETKQSIDELVKSEKMVVLYFGNKTCGVCTIMKPRIEKMIEEYSEIRSLYIDANKFREIAVSYGFFTVPGILLFVEGKETIREAGYINLRGVEENISRYYNLLME